MVLTITDKEANLLRKSISHCLKTCKEGGAKDGCTDCAALEELLKKLP